MSHVDDEKTEAASFWSCLDDIQEGLEVSQSKIVHGTIFILQRFLSIHQAFFLWLSYVFLQRITL